MVEKVLTIILISMMVITSTTFIVLLFYIRKFINISTRVRAKQYTVLNQNATKNQIVFLGDSLTEFYKINEFFHNANPYNRGIANDTTDGVLSRLYDNVLIIEPRKVFLQIGINDFFRKRNIEDILSNIKKILLELRSNLPNANIYMLSLYPVNHFAYIFSWMFTVFRSNNKINALNQKLKEFCESNDFPFINIHPHLLNKKGQLDKRYTVEGLHINNIGYDVISKVLDPYID